MDLGYRMDRLLYDVTDYACCLAQAYMTFHDLTDSVFQPMRKHQTHYNPIVVYYISIAILGYNM